MATPRSPSSSGRNPADCDSVLCIPVPGPMQLAPLPHSDACAAPVASIGAVFCRVCDHGLLRRAHKGAVPMRSARGRVRVLSSLFVTGLLVVLFGSSVGAASLTPSPQEAPYDYERLWHNGCFAFFEQTVPKDCEFGD